MVDLDSETIDVVKKVKDALLETSFKINRIEVGETGAGGDVIQIDVRRHKDEKKNT